MNAKELIDQPLEKNSNINKSSLLSSGCSILNLASSGNVNGTFVKGLCYLFVGDSSTGKTWFTMEALAQAAMNPNFDDYELIYDGPENGAMMNIKKFFGEKLEKRLKPPMGTQDDPINSSVVQEFYSNLRKLQKAKKKFIYVLDSMDALSSLEDEEKLDEQNDAMDKGKSTSGSYGTSKARHNSQNLRTVVNHLADTGSILIIISQTRQNIGFGSQFNPKTRSGGNSLRFFAHMEFWTSLKETFKKKVRGKDRKTGMLVQLEIKKNRIEGWEGKIEIVFHKKSGIDDVQTNIQYLVEESYWKETKGKIDAKEFNLNVGIEELVQHIQNNNLEKELKKLVSNVWKEIDNATTVIRKKKYS